MIKLGRIETDFPPTFAFDFALETMETLRGFGWSEPAAILGNGVKLIRHLRHTRLLAKLAFRARHSLANGSKLLSILPLLRLGACLEQCCRQQSIQTQEQASPNHQSGV